MKAQAIIVIVLSTILFGGCAGKDYDPGQGGFFGGLAGLSSGSYENRVQEREARLAELRTTRDHLNDENARLDDRKSQARVRLAEDQTRVKTMQAEIAELEKKTKALAAKQGADQKRVAELRKGTAALKKQTKKQSSALDALEGSGLGDEAVDLRRKQMAQQRDALRKEYDLLMKMQMELAQ